MSLHGCQYCSPICVPILVPFGPNVIISSSLMKNVLPARPLRPLKGRENNNFGENHKFWLFAPYTNLLAVIEKIKHSMCGKIVQGIAYQTMGQFGKELTELWVFPKILGEAKMIERYWKFRKESEESNFLVYLASVFFIMN